jgi:hypothetical protein
MRLLFNMVLEFYWSNGHEFEFPNLKGFYLRRGVRELYKSYIRTSYNNLKIAELGSELS